MYDRPDCNQALAIPPTQESIRQRLERNKKSIESALADVNRALVLLDKFPEMEEFTDVLRRNGY